MGAFPPPPFEDWVRYCFTRGYDDFAGTPIDSESAANSRIGTFLCLDAVVLTQYLTRLFENPAFIADCYSDDQIADATTLIFGIGSEYFLEVQSKVVPADLQVRCIRSATSLYTDLYDRVCGRRGTDTDSDLREICEVDGAVYMIWNRDYIECTVMFPERNPHLVEPGIGVLASVLQRCRTSACLVSALHGIGHICCTHSHNGDKAIADRMKRMVDAFVDSRELPDWLDDYAACAREGYVQ